MSFDNSTVHDSNRMTLIESSTMDNKEEHSRRSPPWPKPFAADRVLDENGSASYKLL